MRMWLMSENSSMLFRAIETTTEWEIYDFDMAQLREARLRELSAVRWPRGSCDYKDVFWGGEQERNGEGEDVNWVEVMGAVGR